MRQSLMEQTQSDNYKLAMKSLKEILSRNSSKKQPAYYAEQVAKMHYGVSTDKLLLLVTEKYLYEAAYEGNIGIMELVKFHQSASQEQKSKLQDFIKRKKNKEAWKLIQQVTGVKLHKSVNEESKKDILPKAGAGQEGTDELRKTYQKATPGQNIKSFGDYINK